MSDHSIPSPEDRFADALDALTLGISVRPNVDSPLARTAGAIGKIGPRFDETVTLPLDRATKGRIWAALMTEHAGEAEASPIPQVPGAASGTLPLNPWAAREEPAKAQRTRPSPGVLRFIPSAQPTSTFLLVVAVLVLVGGTFASLAPGGGRGIFPSALATENPPQLAFASPEASPGAGACPYEPLTTGEIERIRETGNTQPPREYAPVVDADQETADRTRALVAGLDICVGEDPALFWSMMTDRAVLEHPLGFSSMALLDRSRTLSEEYGEALLGEAPSDEELELLRQQQRSGQGEFPFSSEIVHLMDPDLGVVRVLPDGRLAIYSGEVWLRRDGRVPRYPQSPDRESFLYTMFGNPEFGSGLDESLVVCLGDCDAFWADMENGTYVLPGETPPASPPVITGTCDSEPGWVGRAGLTAYQYDATGAVPAGQIAGLSDLFATFSACMYGPRYEALSLVSTERFGIELKASIAGEYEDIGGRAERLLENWTFPLRPDTSRMSSRWVDTSREAMLLNVLPHTAQTLSDGRIGLLATIAPESVSPVPDDTWVGRDATSTLAVVFVGLIPEGNGALIDEYFSLCGDGVECVSLFGADAASPEASPVATRP